MKSMEFHDSLPLMIYDDKCYVCIKFAKLMNFLAKGKLRMIGHYTEFGGKIRKEILEDDALEMFWFIDENTASGGRAALLPLIKSIFSSNPRKTKFAQMDNICSNECKSAKAVFVRSFTLITNSKKLKYRKSK